MANGLQTTGTKVATSATTWVITLGVTTGDSIFVVGSFAKLGADMVVGDISDDAGNTWVLDKNRRRVGDSDNATIFRCQSAASTATITITVANLQTNMSVGNCFSWRGVNSSPLDVTAGNDGFSSTATSGTTATTAQADELVIAIVTADSATGPTDPPTGGSGTYISLFQQFILKGSQKKK